MGAYYLPPRPCSVYSLVALRPVQGALPRVRITSRSVLPRHILIIVDDAKVLPSTRFQQRFPRILPKDYASSSSSLLSLQVLEGP